MKCNINRLNLQNAYEILEVKFLCTLSAWRLLILSMQFVDNDSLLHNTNVDKLCTQLEKCCTFVAISSKIQLQNLYFLKYRSGLFMSYKSGRKKSDVAINSSVISQTRYTGALWRWKTVWRQIKGKVEVLIMARCKEVL